MGMRSGALTCNVLRVMGCQLNLPFLVPLSTAGWGRQQLGVSNSATAAELLKIVRN